MTAILILLLAIMSLVGFGGASSRWGIVILGLAASAFVLPGLLAIQVGAIRRYGVRTLLPVALLFLSMGWLLILPSTGDIGLYTEFEEVRYQGDASYDPLGFWDAVHTLSLDSTQISRSMAPRGSRPPVDFFEGLEPSTDSGDTLSLQGAVSFTPAADSGTAPTLQEVLLRQGWRLQARQAGRTLFRIETRSAAHVPAYRLAKVDSIVIPTLGERLEGVVVLAASDESALRFRAPTGLVLRTFPSISARDPVIGSGQEEVTVRSIPFAEDEPVAIRFETAGPFFRSRIGNLIATGAALRWLFVAFAGLVGFELQRRLLKPWIRRVLDRLRLPDRAPAAS